MSYLLRVPWLIAGNTVCCGNLRGRPGAEYNAGIWAFDANRAMDVAAVVSTHAFGDPTGSMGRVAYDLGNVYLLASDPQKAVREYQQAIDLVENIAAPHFNLGRAVAQGAARADVGKGLLEAL